MQRNDSDVLYEAGEERKPSRVRLGSGSANGSSTNGAIGTGTGSSSNSSSKTRCRFYGAKTPVIASVLSACFLPAEQTSLTTCCSSALYAAG